jgi:hypothetical protein
MANVIHMDPKARKLLPEEVAALKRHAIQIAAQLPEREEDALAVLEYAKTLVRSFLGDPRPV